MKVIKTPKLIGKDGADLVLSSEQFSNIMNKETNAKDVKIKESFKEFVSKPLPDMSNFSFLNRT